MIDVVIPAYAEPVDLVEMKNHLKVDLSETDDDALIRSQIVAARDLIQKSTGSNSSRQQVMAATTFDLTLVDWWTPWWVEYPSEHAWNDNAWFNRAGYSAILLPCIPLLSVTSITYVDANGATQTLSPSNYSVNLAEGKIYLAYNQTWPTLRYGWNDRITVRFVAGMAAPFTADKTADTITVSGRSFTVGDRVRVVNSGGALPLPLKVNTDYFVLAAGLSLTSGGPLVDITDVGSGTQFIGGDLVGFETLRAAMKLLVGFWYENRSAVDTGRQAVGATVLPFAVEALVATVHA